ncbi:Protein EARLY FLOWERING 3, partial [Mucuna pruriens]
MGMKRGSEDDDKVVGPMFPRLHVNDAEKGGPRAPPRNKMALYEHFSVPSQRFNPNSSSNIVPPPTSSTQGNGHERSYAYSARLPSQKPTHRAESYISRQYDGARSNTSLVQLERRKKVDKDDFHAYICSRIGQSNDKMPESFNGKKFTPLDARNFCSVATQNDGDKDPTQFGSPPVDMRKDVRSGSEVHPQVSTSRQQPEMSVKNKSSGDIIDSLVMQAKVIPNQEDQDFSVPNIRRLHQDDACLQQECVAGSQSIDIEHDDDLLNSTRDVDNGNALVPRGLFHSAMNQTSPLEATNDAEYHDTGTGGPIQKGNFDESGDVSKISTVTNLSSILGQKHFWKARREIANQQRVFAVQVFELHRLIKVQQLIASSPDVMLDDGAFMGQFPLTGSTPKNISLEVVVEPQQQNPKNLSLEVIVEPQQQNPKRKNDSEKLNHKTECSAENAVGKKTSFSSLENGSHLTNHAPLSGNPHQPNVASDNRTSPWCFNQSPGHQWLIPVMSPSEGLVYKPYPGPGFMGTMHGQAPHTFMNPAYQFPASHQVVGVSPFIPPTSHTYFPPFGMPVMNQAASGSAVEQVNQFAVQGSHGQNGHSSVEGVSFNTHHNQSSSNLPLQRNGATLHVKKSQASKEKRGLQGSTTSSPSEMAQGIKAGKIAEGSDAHSLSLHSVETRPQTQVIKVVPHNRKSANESAARIFQSIQEERKQHDSV